MKQLLVILFALFCMQTNAQEYHPMLKDGRSWKLVSPSIFMNEYDLYFTVSVAGDTLVNDIPCKKIVTKCDIPKPWDRGTYIYSCDAAYEKDGRIYAHDPWEQKFRLLMDFNLRKGDTYDEMDRKIQDVDYVEIQGQKHRRIVLWRGSDETDCWIEGIGASDDLHWIELEARPTGNYYYSVMIGCYDDDKLIFTRSDMVYIKPVPNAVEQVKAEPSGDNRTYDMAGRRILSPQKGEVYIKNGEKRVAQ